MRSLAELRSRHLPFLESLEDYDLVQEIAHHQAAGVAVTLKQLLLAGIGSAATVQRRLGRLKRLGVVRHKPSRDDRRSVVLSLSPACMKAFRKLADLMPDPSFATAGNRAADRHGTHLCALCDGDAGSRDVAVRYLGEGLRLGQACLLVGTRPFRDATMVELGRTARQGFSPAQVLQYSGGASTDAMLAAFTEIFEKAQADGKTIRGVDNISWSRGKIDFDSLMDYETRVDALLRRFGADGLCQYDVRRYRGPELLRALKAHPDMARCPMMLG
jgi:DNA-binding MarR family transcriptional regulator